MKSVKKLLWLLLCQWWMNDLRFAVLVLIVLASLAGWFLNTEARVVISGIVVLAALLGISLAVEEVKESPGTSGSTWLYSVSIIGAISILVPLWLLHGIKAWLQ